MQKILLKDIKIRHIDRNKFDYSYCFEDCVATIAQKENVDYQMMYLGYAQFKFDLNDAVANRKVIKDVYKYNVTSDYFKYLEEYHGLRLVSYSNIEKEEYLQLLREELEKGRVSIVRLDSFYIEWDKNFQVKHTNHVGLCIGIDDERIYLCDPYFDITYKEMELSDFQQANRGFIITYDKLTECILKKDNVELKKKILKNVLSSDVLKHRIHYLQDFSKAYGEIFSYETEYAHKSEVISSYYRILDIGGRTSEYFNMLKYLKEINTDIQLAMDDIGTSWEGVKNLLYKGYIKRDSGTGKKIQKLINKIVEKEEIIMSYMKQDI